MTLKEALIEEIEREAAGTKRTLENIPEDKFDWKPHPKSKSLLELATHVVQLSNMAGMAARLEDMDLRTTRPEAPEVHSVADLIDGLEKGTKATIAAIKELDEEDLLNKKWKLHAADYVIVDAPKLAAMRMMALSHMYHHRAQLGVYLRLLDVPVPGVYGPSADDR